MSSLAIPPPEVTKPISFKRILVGTDFSETSRRALFYALALAKRYGAELNSCTLFVPNRKKRSRTNLCRVS